MTALQELRCVPLAPMPVSTAEVALRAVATWLINARKDHPATARGRVDLWRRAVGQVVARLWDVAELTHASLVEVRARGMLLRVQLIRPPRSPIYVRSFQPIDSYDDATRHALYSLASAAARNRPLVAAAGVVPPIGRREAATAFRRVYPERVPGTRRWPRPVQIAVRRRPEAVPHMEPPGSPAM